MNITITINTDNAAFHEGYVGHEVARILIKHAAALQDGAAAGYDPEAGDYQNLRDINGNTVGAYEVTK